MAHKRVDLVEFKQVLTKEGIQLVDVRTPGEYAGGYIGNAQNIDFRSASFLEDLEKGVDKSKPVAIYCAAGGRSAKALEIMKQAGFEEVYELKVGYNGYQE